MGVYLFDRVVLSQYQHAEDVYLPSLNYVHTPQVQLHLLALSPL